MGDILLDLTTLITLVSDCCTQPDKLKKSSELWHDMKNSIYKQLIDELSDPVYPKIIKCLEGKNLIVVRSVYEKMQIMIGKMGSDTEKSEMDKLLKTVKIIDPQPSARFINMGTNNPKKWSSENVDTFGTADSLKMRLITGNCILVRILDSMADRIEFEYIGHRSRSFVGMKINEKLNRSV